MIIERGPHGQLQVFDFRENDELIFHAIEVLQNQLCSLFPKIYIREQLNKKQVCIDCTGLIPLSDFSPSESQWDFSHARKICKEIILRLLDALDYCLPLSCCLLSQDSIWIDPETGSLYISYFPLLGHDQLYDCRLSSLDISAFESLLLHPLFSKHIDEITRHRIVHALEHDDELSLRHIAEQLTESDGLTNKYEKKIPFSLISLVLLLISSSILSISLFFELRSDIIQISFINSGSTLLMFIVICLIAVIFCEHKKNTLTSLSSSPPPSVESGARLLFSTFHSAIPSYSQNRIEKDLFPAFLTEQGEYGNTPTKKLIKRAIWTNDFLIGSNKYTCDLFLDDADIDEMHARILRRANNFYLLDLGSKEGSWISHRKVYSHEETLLCHNDLIRFGHRYFLFSYQYTANTATFNQSRESAGTSNEGATSPPVSL